MDVLSSSRSPHSITPDALLPGRGAYPLRARLYGHSRYNHGQPRPPDSTRNQPHCKPRPYLQPV